MIKNRLESNTPPVPADSCSIVYFLKPSMGVLDKVFLSVRSTNLHKIVYDEGKCAGHTSGRPSVSLASI